MMDREILEPNFEEQEHQRRGWVRNMKRRKHVEGTDDSYGGKIAHFVHFLLEEMRNGRDGLTNRFLEGYEAIPAAANKRKKQYTRRDYVIEQVAQIDRANLADTGVIRSEVITLDFVTQWLATFKGRNGSTPSKSVYGSAQSALVDLFKRHGAVFPQEFYDEIKGLQMGAQKTRTDEKAAGLVPVEERKAAIPGHLYRQIMSALLCSSKKEDIICWAFAAVAWNLMCRVSNVGDVRCAHLNWDADALFIAMVRHKSDQEGERTDPKHCYANPFDPSVCLITALAVLFAVFGAPRTAAELIFEGRRQHDRFVEGIRGILAANPGLKAECDRLNVSAEDIASHSFRKGARSYVQGGVTNGPSTPSILLRGQWALEGMDKKYVRHEGAADQYIGRILAMLDIGSPDFAVLFPHFDNIDDDVLLAVRDCFHGAANTLIGVLIPCFASLVFHAPRFRETLPKQHAIFSTRVFAQGYAQQFAHRVSLKWDNDIITPTGIPPQVSILCEVKQLKETVQNLNSTLPLKLQDIIHAELEQRAVDSRSVTRTVIEQIVGDAVAQLRAFQQQPDGVVSRSVASPAPVVPFQMWMVNGRLRRAPEAFDFNTAVPAETLFQLYCLGNQETRIGPYRNFESGDFTTSKQKKRLSDMKALMSPVVNFLKGSGRWVANPNVQQVNEMWEEGKDVIAVEASTQHGRQRRMHQMAWSTQLKEYRKRARNGEALAPEIDEIDGEE